MSQYKLAAKGNRPTTQIEVKGQTIGGSALCMIAGPCAVENEEQLVSIASSISQMGIKFLRGGAYKPRTSPYAFQGTGKRGLQLLSKCAVDYDLRIVTEVMDTSLIDEVYPYADVLQVGSRNMKNYQFLKELSKVDKPILLKRGMSATIEEWLLAAEYLLLGGNERVILCERGLRSIDPMIRNVMDISAIPLVKELSHLPIIADPSQGTGRRSLVGAMSKAAVAAGADGLMIEVHSEPDEALSDGFQSLYIHQLQELLPEIKIHAEAEGKSFHLEENKRENV